MGRLLMKRGMRCCAPVRAWATTSASSAIAVRRSVEPRLFVAIAVLPGVLTYDLVPASMESFRGSCRS